MNENKNEMKKNESVKKMIAVAAAVAVLAGGCGFLAASKLSESKTEPTTVEKEKSDVKSSEVIQNLTDVYKATEIGGQGGGNPEGGQGSGRPENPSDADSTVESGMGGANPEGGRGGASPECVNYPENNYFSMYGMENGFGITPVYSPVTNNISFITEPSVYYGAVSSMNASLGATGMGGSYSDNRITSTYYSEKTISAVYIGGFGQGIAGNEYIFLLMTDGTIQYRSLYNFKSNSDGSKYVTGIFTDGAKLDGFKELSQVSGITRLMAANVTSKSSTSGHVTVVAYRNDGRFYDLSEYIK